jgi:hypothetical protein
LLQECGSARLTAGWREWREWRIDSVNAMPALLLELHVSPDDLLDYYRGVARTVHTTAANGQTVNFPASALQRHVTVDGVHGWFRLEFDENNKFVRLDRQEMKPGLDERA